MLTHMWYIALNICYASGMVLLIYCQGRNMCHIGLNICYASDMVLFIYCQGKCVCHISLNACYVSHMVLLICWQLPRKVYVLCKWHDTVNSFIDIWVWYHHHQHHHHHHHYHHHHHDISIIAKKGVVATISCPLHNIYSVT